MIQSISVSPGEQFEGEIRVPGDKSISHRALLFGAIAEGETKIHGFLSSEDTRVTARCLRSMGVKIDEGKVIRVQGAGLQALQPPGDTLWLGNSGTTARLLLGILAGQPFTANLIGDDSLNRRPMDRVAIPLRQMGARIKGQGGKDMLPITIQGGHLHPIQYYSPVASAQVKSAILLAGLYVDGVTSVTEPQKSRDHTERMLQSFGVNIREEGLTVQISGSATLRGQKVTVPGDISSAAFFLVAGAIVPGALVTVRGVGINPTRSGVIEVLRAMGAGLNVTNARLEGGEPVADIQVCHSSLNGTEICGEMIPRLIDELPVLAVAAAFARGKTVIADARELRVKESDRIVSVCRFLSGMGAAIEERDDGMVIHGGHLLHEADVICQGDHRIAMSASIAAVAAGVTCSIHGAETIATSFPNFTVLLNHLGAVVLSL